MRSLTEWNPQWGQLIKFDFGFAIFGTKLLTRERLVSLFPSLHFFYLRQTHGVEILQVKDAEKKSDETGSTVLGEGDALWTTALQKALVIQTADCLPIFFYRPPDPQSAHPHSAAIAAVHAGWRGVAQNIVGHCLQHFVGDQQFASTESSEVARAQGNQSRPMSSLRAWIGPHIQFESFEVQRPVLEQLISDENSSFVQPTGEGYRVNLQALVHSEMLRHGLLSSHIEGSSEDTVSNPDLYYSYRAIQRRGQRLLPEERNLSLIVLAQNLW